MRKRINSIEDLEDMGIGLEHEDAQETITLMQEYWNRDIEVYLKDTQVFGLYEVYSEGGIFLGYLTDDMRSILNE